MQTGDFGKARNITRRSPNLMTALREQTRSRQTNARTRARQKYLHSISRNGRSCA